MPEWEAQDQGLLMERYLNSHFEHNWDDFEVGENHDFPDRYVQNENDGMEGIIQEQDNDHETHMPEMEAEDVGEDDGDGDLRIQRIGVDDVMTWGMFESYPVYD
jgi:hypothetical protein